MENGPYPMMASDVDKAACGRRGGRWLLAAGLALVMAFAPQCAAAQGHGGMGMGMGMGMHPFPNLPDVAHGPPADLGLLRGGEAAAQAIANEARSQRLSNGRIEEARKIAKARPDVFETDRNGALAVRSEILAYNIPASRLEAIRKAGFTILRENRLDGLDLAMLVLTKSDENTPRAIRRLRQIAPEGTFDWNHVFFPSGRRSATPLSPPPVQSVGAQAAGIIDTGVGRAIAGLRQVEVLEKPFAGPSPTPADHGTSVAALLLQASRDAQGRMPLKKLYVADVYGASPTGGSAELLVRGLNWMAREQVPVVNVSMVGPPNAMVEAAIRIMVGRGYLIVAPVGNDGPQARPLFPASYPGVVAVSAVDMQDRLLPEASHVPRVDFVAKGIASAPDAAGRIDTVRGTSFAAPIVSGRLSAVLPRPDPVLAHRAVAALAAAARHPHGRAAGYGHGIIDAP